MSQSKTTRTVLSDHITLYTTKQNNNNIRDDEDSCKTTSHNNPILSFVYEVEITSLQAVDITLNFKGSVNFIIENGSKDCLTMRAIVRPFSRKQIGRILITDPYQRASLRMECQWEQVESNDYELQQYLQTYQFNIQKLVKDAEIVNFSHDNVKTIENTCISYGMKFIDNKFAPADSSLGKSIVNNSFAIEWRRSNEFLGSNIEVFSGIIEPNDIKQGCLGDCWFLSAISALAEFPVLIEDLFTDESKLFNKFGTYCIRLCKNGIWQNVIIDDYFPCYPNGGPVYSRSHGNELWVLLLEKAYSKLCGSYESIITGFCYEALIDLTGAPYETIRLDEDDVRRKVENGELWNSLLLYSSNNYIMCLSTPGETDDREIGSKYHKEITTGLIAGHAYSVLKIATTSRGDKIVKLRNPWGSMEWNGDWSDTSPLWTDEMQSEIEPLVQADDGTFWMSFEDVLNYFYSINICMVRHVGLNKHPWKEQRRKFYYEYNYNSDIVGSSITCPSFILTVNKPGNFIFSIHQEDKRCSNSKPYIDIGISVMTVDPVYGTFNLIIGTGNNLDRQNQSKEVLLRPGKYLIVPTTTGCKLKEYIDSERNRIINNKTENIKLKNIKIPLLTINDDNEVDFTRETYRIYEEIFNRMDLDKDGYLNKIELDQFMLRTEGSPIDDNAFKWLLNNFERRDSDGLSLNAFIKAQLYVFTKLNADDEQVRKELELLGYDENLQYTDGKASVVVVHSDVEFILESHSFDESAFQEANELFIIKNGECSSYEDGKVKLYKYKSGYNGLSFVVENKNVVPLIFVLDCSESINICSHRGELKHQETINPGEYVVMHHLLPIDAESDSTKWTYVASYMFDD